LIDPDKFLKSSLAVVELGAELLLWVSGRSVERTAGDLAVVL